MEDNWKVETARNREAFVEKAPRGPRAVSSV